MYQIHEAQLRETTGESKLKIGSHFPRLHEHWGGPMENGILHDGKAGGTVLSLRYGGVATVSCDAITPDGRKCPEVQGVQVLV